MKMIEKGMTFQDIQRNEEKLKYPDLLFPVSKCTDCHEELTEENWLKSHRKKQIYLCKGCVRKRNSVYYKIRKLREKE